jgi:hypothetical protein
MAVESCRKTWKDYLRLETQLLPPGYAWDWSPYSVGKHLLAAYADEFARVHNHLCELADAGIARFSGEITGWSAPDYERLLLSKFGITAAVADDAFCRAECGASIGVSLYGDRYSYVFTITIDDATVITPAVIDYLRKYKQAHTALHIRERQLRWHTEYDINALDVSNAACGSELYTHDYHGIVVEADETFCDDYSTLLGIDAVRAELRDYTQTLCHESALDVASSTVGDPLYSDDWHITERVQTRIIYRPQVAQIYG